jgi:hypothetical protein
VVMIPIQQIRNIFGEKIATVVNVEKFLKMKLLLIESNYKLVKHYCIIPLLLFVTRLTLFKLFKFPR